jgi:hypothetical protein
MTHEACRNRCTHSVKKVVVGWDLDDADAKIGVCLQHFCDFEGQHHSRWYLGVVQTTALKRFGAKPPLGIHEFASCGLAFRRPIAIAKGQPAVDKVVIANEVSDVGAFAYGEEDCKHDEVAVPDHFQLSEGSRGPQQELAKLAVMQIAAKHVDCYVWSAVHWREGILGQYRPLVEARRELVQFVGRRIGEGTTVWVRHGQAASWCSTVVDSTCARVE